MASSLAAVSDVPFSATSTRPFLTLFVGVFAEANARAAAVLIDEFDAGQLQGPPNRQIIGGRHGRLAVGYRHKCFGASGLVILAGITLKIRVEFLGTAVEALAVMAPRDRLLAPFNLFIHAGHDGERPQAAPELVSADCPGA